MATIVLTIPQRKMLSELQKQYKIPRKQLQGGHPAILLYIHALKEGIDELAEVMWEAFPQLQDQFETISLTVTNYIQYLERELQESGKRNRTLKTYVSLVLKHRRTKKEQFRFNRAKAELRKEGYDSV